MRSTGQKIFLAKTLALNCLIDQWVRKHSSKKYDLNGNLASSGEINEIILEQAQELHTNRVIKKIFRCR